MKYWENIVDQNISKFFNGLWGFKGAGSKLTNFYGVRGHPLTFRVTTAPNKNTDLGWVIIMTQIMTHSFENTDLIMTHLVKSNNLAVFFMH